EELFSTNHLFLLDALEIKSWTKEEMIKWLTFQKLRLERDFRISISDEAFKAVVEIKNEPKQAAKLLEEASMEVLDQEDEGSFRLQDLKRKYPESSTKIKKLEASDQEELKSLFRYRQLKAKIKLLE